MDSLRTFEKKIEASLKGAQCWIRDMDGAGRHFEITVVSPLFLDKTRIQRHRMVHAALGSSLGGELHAAKIRALTPDEHQKSGE